MADGNDLEVRIGGDIAGFEAAASRAQKILDDTSKRFQDALDKTDSTTAQSAARQARYLDELARRYDPVYAAQKKYLEQVVEIQRAQQLGALNAEQTEAAIQRAFTQRTVAIQRANGATGSIISANTAAAASSRSLGNAVQQAGFQIGDFAVQVASGQGVLRPLIQQGTQLVSMFGPWGAVIGAAGAVVGALATSFLQLDASTEEAAKSQKEYNDAIERYF